MQIAIRDIQHFLYCPHRWGLMTIDRAWAENAFVIKGNLIHERVHDAEQAYSYRGRKVLTAVRIYNDRPEYELFGVTDCLECTPSSEGVLLADGRRYKLTIVEYKPTAPKDRPFDEADCMQVFAQKVCVDADFGGSCAGVLYYADVKKRIPLPFEEQYAAYDGKLRQTLAQMREYLDAGRIPPRPRTQHCSGCSMKDLCMPGKNKPFDCRSAVRAMLAEEES